MALLSSQGIPQPCAPAHPAGKLDPVCSCPSEGPHGATPCARGPAFFRSPPPLPSPHGGGAHVFPRGRARLQARVRLLPAPLPRPSVPPAGPDFGVGLGRVHPAHAPALPLGPAPGRASLASLCGRRRDGGRGGNLGKGPRFKGLTLDVDRIPKGP